MLFWNTKRSSSAQWQIQYFPEVEAPTLQGAPTYDFAKVSPKLHEIERIWTPVGACIPQAPLRSATAAGVTFSNSPMYDSPLSLYGHVSHDFP